MNNQNIHKIWQILASPTATQYFTEDLIAKLLIPGKRYFLYVIALATGGKVKMSSRIKLNSLLERGNRKISYVINYVPLLKTWTYILFVSTFPAEKSFGGLTILSQINVEWWFRTEQYDSFLKQQLQKQSFFKAIFLILTR